MKIYILNKDFGIASKGDTLFYDADIKAYILSKTTTDERENQSSTMEVYMTLPIEIVENNPEIFKVISEPKSVPAVSILDKVAERMQSVKETIDVLQQSIELLGDADVSSIESAIESLQKEYWTLEWVSNLK